MSNYSNVYTLKCNINIAFEHGKCYLQCPSLLSEKAGFSINMCSLKECSTFATLATEYFCIALFIAYYQGSCLHPKIIEVSCWDRVECNVIGSMKTVKAVSICKKKKKSINTYPCTMG